MKNKDFKSITNILEEQNPNKKFYSFMDFEDTEIRKLEKEGKVTIKTPCQIESLDNEKELKSCVGIEFKICTA